MHEIRQRNDIIGTDRDAHATLKPVFDTLIEK